MTNSGRHRTAAAAGGGSVGILIVWFCTAILDLNITAVSAATLATMAATGSVALGRRGLKGILHRIWVGTENNGNGNGGGEQF